MMMSSRLRRLAVRVWAPASRRQLYLHEYQSKAVMASFGVNVQKGDVASTIDESRQVAARLIDEDAKDIVVKAQILAGGRGKGHFDNGFKGGVKLCHTADQVADVTGNMLGASLVTEQTGPLGQLVSKVLVLQGIDFDRELYFAILLDRTHDGVVVVASMMGGMDIEKVAVDHPEAIHTFPIDIGVGLSDEVADDILSRLGFKGADSVADAKAQMQRLYALFMEKDATQLEINPLVETTDHKVFCVDAKINFDDNAAFRHPKLFAERDFSMEDPREVEAAKFNLNYIGLDGKIGCMVNGAGLAMATMDIIKLHGGTPANFLDVGGSADTEQVAEAFKILNSDPNVEAILVNIFGGIMKCDVIAQGIVDALKLVDLSVPLVVRLEGTNVEHGKRIMEASGLDITMATDLDDAAEKAVHALSS